ncbi:Ferredoxin--NADP reductase [bacterium HR23]|nr:Ferredoxin--NADP reductase [bacterium HR23]
MVDEAVVSKPARPQIALPKAVIVRREDLTPDLWKMWLQPEVPFTFKPGQYCTIGLEGIERAYSIVSAPHEPYLELFIELVPHGELTPRLWKLQVGDKVSIRPRAKGIFTFEPKWPNHVMVATVTGVVPYVSILRDYLHTGRAGHRFYILQGASYHDEFAYDKELGEYARRHPDWITYIPTVSRPHEERNKGWTGQTGRVNLILEGYLQRWGLSPQDTLIYACGHPGMIEDVKARLIPKGWKVKEERFWK